MKQYFEKIEINSESDLPKEDGEYIALRKTRERTSTYPYDRETKELWLRTIIWYLQPIAPTPELTDEDIAKHVGNRRGELLRGAGTMSTQRVTLGEIEWIELCIEVARWVRDRKPSIPTNIPNEIQVLDWCEQQHLSDGNSMVAQKTARWIREQIKLNSHEPNKGTDRKTERVSF